MILSFVVIALAVLAGMGMYPHSPLIAIMAGVVAFLTVEMVSLRRRLSALEEEARRSASPARSMRHAVEKSSPDPEPEPESAGDLDTGYAQSPPSIPVPAQPHPIRPTRPDRKGMAPPPARPALPDHNPTEGGMVLVSRLWAYFTSGNPVLKIGIVVLFFGVAFLLKYAAQRNLIPIEFRLIGVTIGGLALLTTGWFLRRKHAGYGLGLEGGGIGILYLVVFAAARLYHLLPLPLALAIMIALVGLSCALAVLQESKGLAVSGTIGGFLAPVLMSTGAGSHVLLFSYYALLNSGILGIAWFKAWRELNLVGFVFTFGIAAFWGASAYTPAHFSTTEPFLILFFLMYAIISVLFALRQPLQLRGFIDGPLVFGLPIVTAGLQAWLVHDFRYGMALSALALGCWYIGLARLLWSRMAHEMRLLTEAFLALGVVFASLAIPLGLDPYWTTAAWALEGAAMVWVGVRQQRRLARLFGLLLQMGAALTFADKIFYPWDALLFGNHFFLGCSLIALAALFSSYQLDTGREHNHRWEHSLPLCFLAWGLAWWYVGGFRDLTRHLQPHHLPAALLLFTCASTLLAGFFSRHLSWQRLSQALLLLLPVMWLMLPARLFIWPSGSLLTDYGWLAWPLAFFLQYRILALFEEKLPAPVIPLWHTLSLWLVLLVPTIEITWQIDRITGLADIWSETCVGLVPLVLLVILEFQGNRLAWPVRRFAGIYHGLGSGVPLAGLLLWCLASFSLAGNPDPLPYLPVCNPLELVELTILLFLAARIARRSAAEGAQPAEHILLRGVFSRWPAAGIFFLWLNVVCGRCVHFFSPIPYTLDALLASAVFQAAIAALWSILALAMTVWSARKGKRRIWLVGAGLLAMVVCKLFLIDLSGTGTVGRIVSFIVVGILMLIIGFFAPLPPKEGDTAR